MKITSFIIRTLCAGTVGSLACQAAMQAYADDVPSTFVEGNYSPEVARYVQSIAGVALASGIHDYDENATSSYQVLAQVLNSGNVTELPEDLKRAIGMLTGYVPDPNEIIQPIMSRKQIERMRKMADRIKNLMEEKYGVDLEDCTNIMKRTLAPSIPDILRSCGMEGTQLPATTAFRPRLGKALNEAYARLAAPKLPAAGMALGMSDQGFGMWAGTAINDTSSVVAAGQTWASASGSDTALNYATIVKLTRTLAIIPICLGLAYLTSKRKATTSEVKISSIFPMFIIYFLGASIINTFAGSHFDFFQFLPAIGKFMIAMAMAAIGLNTNLVKLIKTGGKPILLGLICWFCIAVVSLAMQHLLNIW